MPTPETLIAFGWFIRVSETKKRKKGLLIGQVVSLTTFFVPKMAEIMVFIFMAAVLLIRPSGLFGEEGLME